MSRNEWLSFRSSCDQKDAPSIGGSSIGCVCGYDDFKHPMIFYLEKIGMKENTFTTNKFTAAGSILEDPVRSNMWAHWNGNDWVASYSANIRHREAYDPYATFWNPEYPWFYMNTDGIITKYPRMTEYYGWGIYEGKTMGGHYSDKYETGFPIKYYFQIQAYMMGTGAQYGEIAVLVDGRDLLVYPIEKSEKVQEEIAFKGEKFAEAIVEGRKVWSDKRMKYNTKVHAIFDIIDNYPYLFEIDHDKNISSTLNKIQAEKAEKQVKKATPDIIKAAELYEECKRREQVYANRKQKISNEIRKHMVHNNIRKLVWKDTEGEDCYISYNKKYLQKT